jgi:hypothetical protein
MANAMLPKNISTPRGLYLQKIVSAASATDLAGWPMLNKDDYALVGGLIVLYSYIDLNLRRIIEVFDHAGLLTEPWRSKADKLDGSEVAAAIQSLKCWDDEGRNALKQIEELRGARNLVAHFTIRRFPSDDAFICIAKSARAYKRQFGRAPAVGEILTAVVDCQQLRDTLKHVEHVQNWLAKAAPKLEQHLSPRP